MKIEYFTPCGDEVFHFEVDSKHGSCFSYTDDVVFVSSYHQRYGKPEMYTRRFEIAKNELIKNWEDRLKTAISLTRKDVFDYTYDYKYGYYDIGLDDTVDKWAFHIDDVNYVSHTKDYVKLSYYGGENKPKKIRTHTRRFSVIKKEYIKFVKNKLEKVKKITYKSILRPKL